MRLFSFVARRSVDLDPLLSPRDCFLVVGCLLDLFGVSVLCGRDCRVGDLFGLLSSSLSSLLLSHVCGLESSEGVHKDIHYTSSVRNLKKCGENILHDYFMAIKVLKVHICKTMKYDKL